MTKEQIDKLIALANNNSNEAEANSAARQVCEELAKVKFEINAPGIGTHWCLRHHKPKKECGCG